MGALHCGEHFKQRKMASRAEGSQAKHLAFSVEGRFAALPASLQRSVVRMQTSGNASHPPNCNTKMDTSFGLEAGAVRVEFGSKPRFAGAAQAAALDSVGYISVALPASEQRFVTLPPFSAPTVNSSRLQACETGGK